MNVLKIIKSFEKYPFVSFDMFDTLVKRNVKDYSDIFAYMELEWKRRFPDSPVDSFVEKRVNAYKEAENEGHGICTIEDIYNHMDIDCGIKNRLLQLEIDTELAFCVPNIQMVELLKQLRSLGKKVVIISDMYLNAHILRTLLKKCGIVEHIDYDALFVSCDVKKRKTDGNLYQYVLKELNIKNKDMIHIGDNWKCDFIRAIQQGIYTIHIPTHENHLHYYNPSFFLGNDLLHYNMLQMTSNNIITEADDEFFRIGVECFGPFMFGFVQWLHEQFEKENIEKIFFLAREGKIMMECYQMLFPEEKERITYMYASRRSIIVPSYSVDASYESICKSIAPSRHLHIQDFFFRVNLNIEDYTELLERLSIPLDYSYSGYEMLENDTLKQLYKYIEADVRVKAEEEYEILVQYLQQIKFEGKKVAIVDIGWNGGMQKALERLPYMSQNNIELHGFYAGINSVMMGTTLKNTHGYLYEKGKNEEFRYYIYGFAGPLEMALTATEGSTKCFKREMEHIVPVLMQSEYIGSDGKSTKEMNSILKIQEGIRQFIIRCADNELLRNTFISEKVAFSALCKFGTEPKRLHLKLYENFGAIDLNAKQNMIGKEYINLFGSKSIRKGLSVSTWKIGFMKYILRLPLPYREIYMALRKRIN